MNREIKFRAWWKCVKEMKYFVPGNFEHIVEHGWVMTFYQTGEDKGIYMGNAEIMQYIGLKDKNGKEIYEGDIIPYSGYFEKQHKTKKFNAVIVFTEYGKFELQFPNGNTSGNIWEYVMHSEVIGNIHENPELLKP